MAAIDAIGEADGASLDAVQRRQERHEGEHNVLTPRPPVTAHMQPPSAAIVGAARLIKLQGEQQSESVVITP